MTRAEAVPAQLQPLSRGEQRTAMLGVYATLVVLGLEATIPAIVLPQAADELQGLELYALVGTVSALATTISILLAARLGDWLGRKPVLLGSMALLLAGSVLAVLAPGMELMILARALAGIASGMIIAGVGTAPADVFPDPAERIRWQGLNTVAYAGACSVGPLLGGAAASLLGWRAAFFVAPLAALLSLGLLLRFPRLAPHREALQGMDWRGALLIACALGAPLLAMSFAFGSLRQPPLALTLAVLAAVAAAAFVAHARRTATPFLPLRLFSTGEARVLLGGALVSGALSFLLMFYGPLLLQSVVGRTPAQAGALIAPMLVAMPLGSVLNGLLFRRQERPERLLHLGHAVLVLGCALLLAVALGLERGNLLIASGFALCGLGLGLVQPNQALFMQMLVERRDLGVATGLVSVARAFGGSFGTALVGVVMAHSSPTIGIAFGLGASLLCCCAALLVTAVAFDTRRPVFQSFR